MHTYSTQVFRSELRPEGWLDKRYELKQQREVTSSATAAPNANSRSRPAEVAPRQQPQSPAQQEKDPSLDPLDPGTIQQVLATVRGLPRPALEGFTKAFRKRFQVPPDAPSIADRISQRRHH